MTSTGDNKSLSGSNAAEFGILIYKSLYHNIDYDGSKEIDSFSIRAALTVPDFIGSL